VRQPFSINPVDPGACENDPRAGTITAAAEFGPLQQRHSAKPWGYNHNNDYFMNVVFATVWGWLLSQCRGAIGARQPEHEDDARSISTQLAAGSLEWQQFN